MIERGLALYVVRRLLALCLLLVVISFAVFSLLYISPGNVVDTLIGTNPRTPAMVSALRKQYHLDQPFLTQYWIWARQAFQFHFGTSIQSRLPVTDELRSRLPVSLFLGLYAFILTIVVGIGGGIAAALRRRTSIDRGVVGAAVIALSTPPFVSGVLLLYLFGIVVHWFPVYGDGSGFVNRLWHLTLPAIALALGAAAFVVKHTRAALLGVLDEDYIVFARARGLSARRVLFVYALRNALIPVVTISGLVLGSLITGAVLVETVFSLPGIGQLLVQSATTKDVPMIQGIALAVAVVITGANLLADVIYVVVDPRIRLGARNS